MRMRLITGNAVAVLAVAGAIAGCGGSSSGLSDQNHRDFVGGCTNSGTPAAGCECLFTQLTQNQGLNTESKIKGILSKAQAAIAAHDPSAVPTEFQTAAKAC